MTSAPAGGGGAAHSAGKNGTTAAKRVARSLLSAYGKRLRQLMTTGQQRGELSSDITADAAAAMFIGAIQGLVMQTLLNGKPQHIRSAAPGVFALYRRCIRSQP